MFTKGYIPTIEQRQKQSLVKLGGVPWNKNKNLSAEHRKNLSIALSGRSISDETKQKLSDVHVVLGTKPPVYFGENNFKWSGGHNMLYLRKKVLVRDNYTCQICGLQDKEIMQVDHQKPKKIFPELKFNLNNLLSLCPNCHARKTKTDRKWIAQVLKGRLSDRGQLK